MRDIDDLQATWAELEAIADEYPLRDASVHAARAHTVHPHRSRRIGLAVAAGATVAAIAVAATVLTTRSSQHNAAPPAHRTSPAASHSHSSSHSNSPAADEGWSTLPTGHYLFRFDQLPGTTITSVIGVGTDETRIQDSDAYQEVQVTGPYGGLVFKVNTAGSWQPSGGQPVTVDGRAAFYDRFLLHPEIPGHPVLPRVALAWQYAPGAWVTVASTSSTPIPLDRAERVAGLVQIEVGDAIPSPPPQGP